MSTATERITFKPNRLTFAEGLENLKNSISGRIDLERIVTSKDVEVMQLAPELQTENVPNGFEKFQLPFYFEGGPGAQFFFSKGEAGAHVPKHAHTEGAGVRFIIDGSIEYEGKTLEAGDWMFIPAGQPYSFDVGPGGVWMAYCYCCCCA